MNNPSDEQHTAKLASIVESLQNLNESVSVANGLLNEIIEENHETEITTELWNHYHRAAEFMLRSDRPYQAQQHRQSQMGTSNDGSSGNNF